MHIPIYIVNLKRSPERKMQMQQKLDALGVLYTFVEGVDGKDKSVCDFIPEYNPTTRKQKFGRHLRPTEIGCSLSHLKILQIAHDAGHDRILVMEDDIVFLKHFMPTLQIVSNLDDSYECIRLYCGTPHKMKPVYTQGDITISRQFRATLGSQAYYINRTGITKALQHGLPIQYPWDKYIFGYWRTDIRVFATKPNVVFGEDIATVPTTIDYDKKDSYDSLYNHWVRIRHQAVDEWLSFLYRIRHFKDFYGR